MNFKGAVELNNSLLYDEIRFEPDDFGLFFTLVVLVLRFYFCNFSSSFVVVD